MKKLDVSKHELVPKHSKAGEKEKAELLKRFNTPAFGLPRISKSDPAIAGLGAKPGDVIRIARKSPTAGQAVFYRVVVNA